MDNIINTLAAFVLDSRYKSQISPVICFMNQKTFNKFNKEIHLMYGKSIEEAIKRTDLDIQILGVALKIAVIVNSNDYYNLDAKLHTLLNTSQEDLFLLLSEAKQQKMIGQPQICRFLFRNSTTIHSGNIILDKTIETLEILTTIKS